MNRKGVTLLELLVAISMLGVISIGFASVEIFARYQTISSDRRSQILNEAAIAVEAIAQKVRHSEGWINALPFIVDEDGRGVNIRKDDGIPSTISEELCRFEFLDNALYYKDTPASAGEMIAKKIIEFELTPVDPADPDNPEPEKPYALKIWVKTVYDPAADISYPDNPDAAIETSVSCPSVSMG